MGLETQVAVVVAHAGEAINGDHPTTPDGGNMAAVLDVAGVIRQINQQRFPSIRPGLFRIADLKGGDAFYTNGDGGVPGGEEVIIVEVTPLLLQRKLIPEQEHG